MRQINVYRETKKCGFCRTFYLIFQISLFKIFGAEKLPQGNGNMEDGELASRGGYPYTFPPLAQRGTSKAFHSTADTRCARRSEMSEHIRRVRAVTKPS